MTRQPVTDNLLHDLVAGSHTQGITLLAVAVRVENNHQILLVDTASPDASAPDASEPRWQLLTDLVLPGETLPNAVSRTAATIGVSIEALTGYLGHHDDLAGSGDTVRTFMFTAAPHNPDDVERGPLHGPHRWVPIDALPRNFDTDLLCGIHPSPVDTDSPDQLSATLRTHANGLLAAEAAVELLISHHHWLHRSDFIDRYITADPGPTTTARVDWTAATTALDTGTLTCSNSQARMLRIAASLAADVPVNLGDTITSLDNHNLDLVTKPSATRPDTDRSERPPHAPTALQHPPSKPGIRTVPITDSTVNPSSPHQG